MEDSYCPFCLHKTFIFVSPPIIIYLIMFLYHNRICIMYICIYILIYTYILQHLIPLPAAQRPARSLTRLSYRHFPIAIVRI